jgi:hypothetical protein
MSTPKNTIVLAAAITVLRTAPPPPRIREARLPAPVAEAPLTVPSSGRAGFARASVCADRSCGVIHPSDL